MKSELFKIGFESILREWRLRNGLELRSKGMSRLEKKLDSLMRKTLKLANLSYTRLKS
jgi:hypothetical protein